MTRVEVECERVSKEEIWSGEVVFEDVDRKNNEEEESICLVVMDKVSKEDFISFDLKCKNKTFYITPLR